MSLEDGSNTTCTGKLILSISLFFNGFVLQYFRVSDTQASQFPQINQSVSNDWIKERNDNKYYSERAFSTWICTTPGLGFNNSFSFFFFGHSNLALFATCIVRQNVTVKFKLG